MDPIYRKRSKLNQLWNASLFVHTLPNELLVHIFTHFLDLTGMLRRGPSWSAHRDRSPDRIGWRHLMLVCRHWRSIFLSTTVFWQKIDLQRPVEWTILCLTRSVEASLDVSTRNHIVYPLEVLHHHARRFRTLRLDIPRLEMALPSLFRTPMPLLEDLHLDIESETKPDIQLTSQRLPHLRVLTLRGTRTPQNTSLFAQLRVISLSQCSFNSSFDAFLDTLAASVRLEELALRATLSYPSDEWVHDDSLPRRPPISLPHLRKFTIAKHEIVRTSCFLAHLCIPPSASLFVKADYVTEPFGAQAVSSVSEMLPPNRAAALPILATATEVDLMSWQDDYKISCKPLPGTVSWGPGYTHTSFRLSALDPNDELDWDPFMAHGLADLVRCFGQAPVTCLTVSGKHDYGTVDAWEGVFRAFPRLRFLTVDGADDSRITSAFRGLHAASTRAACSGELPAIACRDLKEVEVEGLGLVETYEAMEECFRYRGENGVILRVLDLKTLFRTDGGATRQERQEFVDNLCEAVEYIELLHDSDDSESEESDGTV